MNINKIKFSTLCFVLLSIFKMQAQLPKMRCGASKVMEYLYETRPDSKISAERLDKITSNFLSDKIAKESGEYIIPVVVHVFGSNFNGTSLNDAIIEDAIEKTNNDYQGLTSDWNDIIPEFDGVKKALNITFKLAKIDPDGNSTTGIIYYPNAAGFGNGDGYDTQIQQYAWDNYKYMNVYIQNDLYNDGTTNNSGVAWYPDSWMSDHNLARVVYNGAYIGTNTDENFRRVLTHEFGHWLNLIHTFEGGCPDGGSCSTSGDKICDTPPADNSNMNGALNCQGVVTNWENFMDYSSDYSMFTIEQVARMEVALQHSTRFPLWQTENLMATGVNLELGARLTISTTNFAESYLNDGSISNTSIISCVDGAAFLLTGNLTEGVHFTTTNVPAGLSMNITVENSTTATLSFSGNSSVHSDLDDLSGISVTFLDPAIVGGVSSLFSPTIFNLTVNFIDPYQIVYEDIADISVNSVNTWKYFQIKNGQAFGIWVENGNLRFETYSKAMVCEGSSFNISKIPYNQVIDQSSNWKEGGEYPNEHDLRTSGYTLWDGQTAYMAFQFKVNDHPCFGWFKVKVSESGDSYSILEYAYNEKPYGAIAAGTTNENAETTKLSNELDSKNFDVMIYPNPTNNVFEVSMSELKKAKLQISTLNGKIMMEKMLNASIERVVLDGFQKGIYLIKIISDDKIVVKKMVIK